MCALTAGPGRHQRHERDRVGEPQPARRCWCSEGARRNFAGGRARFRRSITSRSSVRWSSSPTPRLTTAEIPALVDEAMTAAITPHSGPVFLDFPLDQVFWRGRRARAGRAAARALARAGRRCSRDRAGRRRAARRRAAGDHGRRRALLGPRRGVAAGARGRAADPGVPQRPRARMPARRPRAGVLAGSERRAAGRRRRARDRRAARLPARLRRGVRRRTPRSSRSTSPSPTATTRGRSRPSSTARCRPRSTRSVSAGGRAGRGGVRARGVDRSRCGRSRRSAAPPRPASWPTTARRFTRCASTAS